jgi:putative DNA primase/helicase
MGHPTDIARLAGARLVITSELEDGQRFAEARIKQLTGRDTLTGRFMRQDFFSFTPTHTMWLLANHQPEVRAGGPAFWRRISMIPFLHTVPEDHRNPHLEDQLVADEGPGILAWCAAGARDYLTSGVAKPASVVEATQAYEEDQDTITRFVAQMCETGSPGRIDMRAKVLDIRGAYESWCHVEGERAQTPKAFTLALRAKHGVVSERVMAGRFYTGIKLLQSQEEEAQRSWDSWEK